MTTLTDCRFCLEKKRHVLEITNEIQNTFYLITQMKLNKLKNFSNSICFVCYKKLLAAQGYREMLVKIEEKLLTTFVKNTSININTSSNTTNNNVATLKPRQLPCVSQQEPKVLAHRTRSGVSNGQPSTSTPNNFKKIKLSNDAKKDDSDGDDDDDDEDEEEEDMSLLEEIVSFNAPDTSLLINEQEHDKHYSFTSDMEMHHENFVKQEPTDRPIVEIDESSNSNSHSNVGTVQKPWPCDVPGCYSSSTTLVALKKHRRRVHGIRVQRMRQGNDGIKIKPNNNSLLYNQLLINGETNDSNFKCKYCDLMLKNQRVLSRHVETVHRQAKFYCTVEGCNHASTRKDNYRLHLKNYHRNLPEDELQKALEMTRDMKPIYKNKNLAGFDESDNMQDDWMGLPQFEDDDIE